MLIMFASLNVYSQQGTTFLDSKELLPNIGPQIEADALSNINEMPVGNLINPDFYYLGPGDVLSMQIVPAMPLSRNVTISPDGSVLIPRLGVINVKGMTLNQAKDTINKIVKKNNPNSDLFLTLKNTRSCLVDIRGNVFSPTIYTLPSAYQVSTAIAFANKFTTKEGTSSVVHMESVLKIREKKKDVEKLYSTSGLALESEYWRRNVQLVRNDGSSQIIDIEKAIINKDPSLDPYIREGDIITVPYNESNYAKISVSGGVVRPVELPFKQGDKASELIKYGYGFKNETDFDNIQIFMPISGRQIKIEVDSTMKMKSPDFELEPGSQLIVGVKANETIAKYGTVSLQGYVKKPGTYLIKLNETKIKDIIEQAGGFTDQAYLPLARVSRRQEINSTLIDPRKDIFEAMQYSDLTADDTTRFFIDIMYKKPIVACDLNELYKNNSERDNVILHDGDVISIPANPGYIEVMGQVKNPGMVEFVEGRNMLWYINRTGGAAEGSELDRARIIRGRTNAWIEGDEKTIVYAGDRIYVPRIPDEPNYLKLQRYSIYIAIASTFSYIVFAILQALRP